MEKRAELSIRTTLIPKILLKLAAAAALAILAYYAYEGISAALSASPIFAAIFLTLLIAAIIIGIMSLLT